MKSNGGQTVYEKDDILTRSINENKIIQTKEQTINAGFNYFMIVAHETTEGTGTINHDISFDGGSNEQSGLSSFVEYKISDTGTSLILKSNLNAGASQGPSEIEDWGVLLW
jgi:hypothetical protein